MWTEIRTGSSDPKLEYSKKGFYWKKEISKDRAFAEMARTDLGVMTELNC